MASRKTKKAFALPELSETQIVNLCMFFIIAFYIYLKVYITSRIGLSGAAYAFSALDFIVLFIILVPYSIKHTVYKYLRVKIQSQQFKNAKRFIYCSYIVVISYSIVISLLLLLLKSFICKEILINKSSELCLLFLIPAIIFTGISGVIKGYIQATNNTGSLLIIELIEKIAMIVGVIIFSNAFNNYGEKVALVLNSPEYKSAFGAAGACLGISVGLLISMLFNLFLYSGSVKKLNRTTVRTKTDDIYDIMGAIKNETIRFVPPFFFIVMFFVISQTFFFRSMSDQGKGELITYQWGAFNGVFINILLIPVLWIVTKTYFNKNSLLIATRTNNVSELRSKISSMIVSIFSYVIPCFVYILIAAPHIIKGFVLVDSDFATKTLRLGSILILILPVCISFIVILQSINQQMVAVLNGIISLVLSVACLIIFVFIIKLEMIGILISSIVGALVFLVLNLGPIRKTIRTKINYNKAIIIPLIASLVVGILVFLINLLLGLFLPSALIVIFSLIVYVILMFIAYAKFGVATEYTLKKAFMGGIFYSLGKAFNLF